MVRHCITVVKELSTAKQNAFKNVDWPLQLMKLPGSSERDTIKLRIKSLKFIKQIMQFMSAQHLTHLAEVVDLYMSELSTIIMGGQHAIEPLTILNYLRNLCSVGFKLNNLIPLDRHNFALFCSYIDKYYALGF